MPQYIAELLLKLVLNTNQSINHVMKFELLCYKFNSMPCWPFLAIDEAVSVFRQCTLITGIKAPYTLGGVALH